MNNYFRGLSNGAVFVCVFLALTNRNDVQGETITFDLFTDQSNYTIGETVNWGVTLSITNSTDDNFGADSIAINLADSAGDALSPGVIDDFFSGYAFPSGGTFNPADNGLLEISVTTFTQGSSVLRDGDQLLNIPFVTGSYTANTPGNHMLVGTAGSTNNFFTAANALTGTGDPYDVQFNNVSFNVVAVPEPSSLVVVGMVTAGIAWRRRRASKRNG